MPRKTLLNTNVEQVLTLMNLKTILILCRNGTVSSRLARLKWRTDGKDIPVPMTEVRASCQMEVRLCRYLNIDMFMIIIAQDSNLKRLVWNY